MRNELTDHCTYELDCSSEDLHAALQRLVELQAITPAILLEYEDERVVLQDVYASVQEFVLSRETELKFVHAVGLRQAYSDHAALLEIFELKPLNVKARFGPEQDPDLAVGVEFSDELGLPEDARIKKTARTMSKDELDEVISYWASLPRGSAYHDEPSLIRFLAVFTPAQVKGAMYIAKSKPHPSYFKYLCGILHNWRRELEASKTPKYFIID